MCKKSIVSDGIRCDICGSDTYVYRTVREHKAIVRFRKCKACGYNMRPTKEYVLPDRAPIEDVV